MCGICGVATTQPERPVDASMLRQMTGVLRHRGPDSDGFHLASGIGLGVQRLAINDLRTGDQPISNEDSTITVVCNGEIYNFLELRQTLVAAGHRFRSRSDVEVIIHLYEEHGVDCLDRLRGMFAFALWDAPRRQLMLARDRLGIKPLLYAIGKDGCYFGSEYKSILMADRIERRLDVEALEDVFTLGFVTGSKTFFTEIRRLPPGHYLLYARGQASVHQYWDVPAPSIGHADRSKSSDEWAEAILEKLRESVSLHLRGDVPIGAWLSAGLDSSSVVALMERQTREPVQTFSVAFEDPAFDEVRHQRTLDRFPGYDLSNRSVVCGAVHFELFSKAAWHLEDPWTNAVQVPRLLVSEAAARDVKVVLTGEGSDEVFGGYPWFSADRLLRPFARLPLPLRRMLAAFPPIAKRWPGGSRLLRAPLPMSLGRYRALIAPVDLIFLPRLFTADWRQSLSRVDGGASELRLPPDFRAWHPFAQLQYYELKIRLPDDIVHELDRTSMAYSLEARVPFLDHELVELCARIPGSLKEKGPREKDILRRAMAGHLPAEIAQRKKRGLTSPRAAWLRGRLPDFAAELLSERSLADKGYFDPRVVAQLLAQHRAGAADHASSLLAVLGTQLWDDLFMRGCRPPAQPRPGGTSR
ncbi:MAG: asparagine synthase (glutamine-hydrolyzing) [Chloroflexi bacterium]|nr:asparagine synthase (glutamine-hydrolyzing) [Chloroflexota bacterium]